MLADGALLQTVGFGELAHHLAVFPRAQAEFGDGRYTWALKLCSNAACSGRRARASGFRGFLEHQRKGR